MSYLGGVIAGVLGAILWAAISYYGNVEIGWLAWGIGAVVGVAISMGTKGGGLMPAVVAVVVTVLSLCGGKYLAVRMAVSELADATSSVHFELTDEDCVCGLAGDAVDTRMLAGEDVVFPNGKTFDDVEGLADYPADIAEAAQDEWDAKTPAEQAEFKAERMEAIESIMSEFKSSLVEQGFMASFSGMDILFFLLGIASAGKIAFSDDD